MRDAINVSVNALPKVGLRLKFGPLPTDISLNTRMVTQADKRVGIQAA
jgi:hypothetical protein